MEGKVGALGGTGGAVGGGAAALATAATETGVADGCALKVKLQVKSQDAQQT
jgi:hypothetical protein